MLHLLPGLLMVVESVLFLVLEWRLRAASGWRAGALDQLTRGVVIGPLVVFLLGALILSTGGWDLLRLPGVLIVLVLPVALAAAAHTWLARPALLALGLSLAGLVVVAIGAQA